MPIALPATDLPERIGASLRRPPIVVVGPASARVDD
jgi:hypothetical protein